MWAGQVSGVLLLEHLPVCLYLEEAPKRQVSGLLGDLDVETAVCDPYVSPSLATLLRLGKMEANR